MLHRLMPADKALSFESARKLKYFLANEEHCKIYAMLIKKEPKKTEYYKNKIKILGEEISRDKNVIDTMKKITDMPVSFFKEKKQRLENIITRTIEDFKKERLKAEGGKMDDIYDISDNLIFEDYLNEFEGDAYELDNDDLEGIYTAFEMILMIGMWNCLTALKGRNKRWVIS